MTHGRIEKILAALKHHGCGPRQSGSDYPTSRFSPAGSAPGVGHRAAACRVAALCGVLLAPEPNPAAWAQRREFFRHFGEGDDPPLCDGYPCALFMRGDSPRRAWFPSGPLPVGCLLVGSRRRRFGRSRQPYSVSVATGADAAFVRLPRGACAAASGIRRGTGSRPRGCGP